MSWDTRHMDVLVIEGEAPIREFEVTYLRDAGYGTIEAADGQAAVELFVEHQPDLAIIDLNLPKMSGLDVCKAIRTTSTMPILIVTARDSDEDEVKGLSMGADDYIKKPFNPNVLVARVQALLRRHERTRRLHFKGLVIDPEARSVYEGWEGYHAYHDALRPLVNACFPPSRGPFKGATCQPNL